ncbi:hypothetical protein ACFC1D_00135 [Streptomyces vinaceus]|uniref:hypothetical protein n=1 Tax=Streptomyces vinaceus TaxID=1960 RepID=UPI0035E2977F
MTDPYGLLSPEFFHDPYPAYARMGEANPVCCHPPMGAWLLSRYEDVDALLRHRRTSAERAGPLLAQVGGELAGEAPVLARFFGDWMVFAMQLPRQVIGHVLGVDEADLPDFKPPGRPYHRIRSPRW